MAELADAADSKSAEVHPSWGFNSPSRHQQPLKMMASIEVLRASRSRFRLRAQKLACPEEQAEGPAKRLKFNSPSRHQCSVFFVYSVRREEFLHPPSSTSRKVNPHPKQPTCNPPKRPKKIGPSSRQIQQQNAPAPRKLRAILHRSFLRSGYEIESERDAQSVGDRGRSAHDKPGHLPAFRPVK